VTVRPMEQVAVELAADHHGTWLIRCHNLAHAGGGLMAEVRCR
jgi:FtsP/CotA-like multicopper oxidase with cupredoxin domain